MIGIETHRRMKQLLSLRRVLWWLGLACLLPVVTEDWFAKNSCPWNLWSPIVALYPDVYTSETGLRQFFLIKMLVITLGILIWCMMPAIRIYCRHRFGTDGLEEGLWRRSLPAAATKALTILTTAYVSYSALAHLFIYYVLLPYAQGPLM